MASLVSFSHKGDLSVTLTKKFWLPTFNHTSTVGYSWLALTVSCDTCAQIAGNCTFKFYVTINFLL